MLGLSCAFMLFSPRAAQLGWPFNHSFASAVKHARYAHRLYDIEIFRIPPYGFLVSRAMRIFPYVQFRARAQKEEGKYFSFP